MHWKEFKKQDRVYNGKTVKMSHYYLFNPEGLTLGRIETRPNGSFVAYIGRKGLELGTFFNLGDAKQAVKATIGK